MRLNPLHCTDGYKLGHIRQYPDGTTEVYSNFTARSSKHANVLRETFDEKIVFFGLQYFIKDFLIDSFNEDFFRQPKQKVVSEYKDRVSRYLRDSTFDVSHIEALHDLGYLPIRIKALPEGSLVPIKVPVLTIVNTHPDFFWLTNYLETALSAYLWRPITSATTAFEYKKLLWKNCEETCESWTESTYLLYQAHDFSFRGMSNVIDAAVSGAAHLTSFAGTDNIPAIDFVEKYYPERVSGGASVGESIPATEHSVMCAGTEEGELTTFKRLITKVYPSGFVSIVSDTWDFWQVVTEYLPALKDVIMGRDGRVIIRPDSGCPVKILTGDPEAPVGSPQYKGAVECLWDIFGGTEVCGLKKLDGHIGIIYGDSITLKRADEILRRLREKGFHPSCAVFGVGSYSYQLATRDSFGMAVKSTSVVVNGVRRDIYKNPKTDDGTKKSARGLLVVEEIDDELVLRDGATEMQEDLCGCLETVFLDGTITVEHTFDEIRERLQEHLPEFGGSIWGF